MEWRLILFVLPTLFALTCGSETMVGGFKDLNIENNLGAQKALRAAVEDYNNRDNCRYLFKVREVKKVQVQVVEGFLYKITAIMAKTTCRKGRNPEMCPLFEDTEMAQSYECTFRVWSRPWLDSLSVEKQEGSCKNYVGKDSV